MSFADVMIVLIVSLIVGWIIYRMVVRKDDDLCARCAYANKDACATKKKTTF